MIYLEKFILPDLLQEENDNHLRCKEYPYGIFPFKKLKEIDFSNITIFYGTNGSGKSTLLNIIAQNLDLPRNIPFNFSDRFDRYAKVMCEHSLYINDEGIKQNIPMGSKIIASDDIFNCVLNRRYDNININKKKEIAKEKYFEAKFGSVKFESLENYETLKLQNETRNKTMSSFVRDRSGSNIKMNSNGESALEYFDKEFESGKLYLLDEPENSLSPNFQIQLIKLILDCVYYCDCQFIIATHSPFLLSIEGALIYDLDSTPVITKNWYELENVKIYYNFFKSNERFF